MPLEQKQTRVKFTNDGEPVFSRWVNHARSVTFTMGGEDVYTRQVYPGVFGWTDENNGGPECRRCQDAKEV